MITEPKLLHELMQLSPNIKGYVKDNLEAFSISSHLYNYLLLEDTQHNQSNLESTVASKILTQSIGYLFGAIQLTFNGQVFYSFPLLRSFLESAILAHAFVKDKKYVDYWLNDEMDTRPVNDLAMSRLITLLPEQNDLQKRVKHRTNLLIKGGAHPTKFSLSMHDNELLQYISLPSNSRSYKNGLLCYLKTLLLFMEIENVTWSSPKYDYELMALTQKRIYDLEKLNQEIQAA
ncbi:MAG: hypothetical protein COY40_03350 [Alphaproteobacteria bacterium CG_4_10_14_0_8_um_filter_53_9]|nr:MAG: hypothetical protein COY40_03350 [Alphaproteobacteria bacterium CG_4_10_14_0_8_um_filter_53_9]